LDASTSHASDSELNSLFIKPVIVDTTCLDSSENSCLNNCVKPESKDSGIQAHGKFVPTCHNCGKVGHIRPNCFLLKTHRSWIKHDAPRKGKVEKPSSSKYVPPQKRHIKGKDSVICKNANLKSAETIKKYSNKRSLPTYHHCGIIGQIRPKCPQLQAQKSKVQRELPTKATSGTLPPTTHRLHGISGDIKSLFLPIKVANQRRANQGASKESRRSPIATMAMRGC
jgi:hypothetical protein